MDDAVDEEPSDKDDMILARTRCRACIRQLPSTTAAVPTPPDRRPSRSRRVLVADSAADMDERWCSLVWRSASRICWRTPTSSWSTLWPIVAEISAYLKSRFFAARLPSVYTANQSINRFVCIFDGGPIYQRKAGGGLFSYAKPGFSYLWPDLSIWGDRSIALADRSPKGRLAVSMRSNFSVSCNFTYRHRLFC